MVALLESVYCISRIYKYSTLATAYLPTIYALSTPPGQRSAIAIVRISGSHSKYIYRQLTKSKHEPIPRTTSLKKLYFPYQKNVLLDTSLTLFFNSPKTFTGEDILELHLHGGKAVTGSVLEAIGSLNDRESGVNIRYAQPGEFSMRAFQNGKFDLTEIEGIRELIDAETESQRRSALASFNGENKQRFMLWRKTIVDNIAQLAAIIDFGDDTDIGDLENIFSTVESNMLQLKGDVQQFIKKVEKSSILQSGIKLVLLGPPNAGKSSLINSISNDDISIVSQIPGTTRDTIELAINVNGYKVIMCDTAGIRGGSSDEIEMLGIKRAIRKSTQCDLCLLILDPQSKPLVSDDIKHHLMSQEFQNKEITVVVNKTDLINDESDLNSIIDQLNAEFNGRYPIVPVSCLTTSGIEELINGLTQTFQKISETSNESDPIVVSQRVQEILFNDVLYGINEFLMFREKDNDVVMASESLRYAAAGIGKITGETVGIEEVLGVVFANFCVGK